jgi:hypothetical protein
MTPAEVLRADWPGTPPGNNRRIGISHRWVYLGICPGARIFAVARARDIWLESEPSNSGRYSRLPSLAARNVWFWQLSSMGAFGRSREYVQP